MLATWVIRIEKVASIGITPTVNNLFTHLPLQRGGLYMADITNNLWICLEQRVVGILVANSKYIGERQLSAVGIRPGSNYVIASLSFFDRRSDL